MARHLTTADCEARAIAPEEAAEHLGQNWTDDPRERVGGQFIERMLRAEAAKWRDRVTRERARKQRRASGLTTAMSN